MHLQLKDLKIGDVFALRDVPSPAAYYIVVSTCDKGCGLVRTMSPYPKQMSSHMEYAYLCSNSNGGDERVYRKDFPIDKKLVWDTIIQAYKRSVMSDDQKFITNEAINSDEYFSPEEKLTYALSAI